VKAFVILCRIFRKVASLQASNENSTSRHVVERFVRVICAKKFNMLASDLAAFQPTEQQFICKGPMRLILLISVIYKHMSIVRKDSCNFYLLCAGPAQFDVPFHMKTAETIARSSMHIFSLHC
jgi:hypothetical protein